MIKEQQEAQDVIDQVLKLAKQQGASAAEASLGIGAGLSASVRMGELETVEHNKDKGLGLTVFMGHKTGSASTSDLKQQSLQETVVAACRIAQHTSEDPYTGLVDAERMAKNIPDLDLYHPWAVETETAVEMAQQCEASALGFDPRISNSDGVSVNQRNGLHVYGNSHGLIDGWASSSASLVCTVIAEDKQKKQRDYWYSVDRNYQNLQEPKIIGEKAAQRAVSRLNADQIPTGEVPVLFEASVATSLFGHLISAISGGSLYRKTTFLLDHLDQQIFPDKFRIHEQPLLRAAIGSAPFDGDGVATQNRDLISNGVLQSYVLAGYSSRKLGMRTTGNAGGVRNLTIETGDQNFNQLLAQMGTGLLVTELMGFGGSIVTGDYSRGAAGFWVENGELQYPVEEITIAGHLKEIFMGIQAVGNDIEKRGNIRTGSVLIDHLKIAGK